MSETDCPHCGTTLAHSSRGEYDFVETTSGLQTREYHTPVLWCAKCRAEAPVEWFAVIASDKARLDRLQSERRLAVDVLREIRDECIAGARLSAAKKTEALIEDLSR